MTQRTGANSRLLKISALAKIKQIQTKMASPLPFRAAAFKAAVRPSFTRTLVKCAATPAGGPPTNPAGADRDYKVALVTGGNTGIGFITAQSLAEKGYYVVLGCRNKEKAEAARDRIKASVPGNRGVEVANFDLADLASVQAWASRARDFGLPLDVLVNNAGVMACPEMRTKDGF